ncbi:MAG: S1/P1 nuclease [Marinicellaceae bacterium]
MKKIKNIIFIVLLFSCFQAFSWGQTGHRVTGAIAEHYLTDEARTAINKILINEDLAEASTFADEMRSNPDKFWQETANPWHYVNVYEGKTYDQMKIPKEGDSVTALEYFSQQLKSNKTQFKDKQIALRFIIHIVGDLHQPLHSGTDKDHGGNKIKVKFFSEESNLHKVWDEDLIDKQKLSYTEWAFKLQRKISLEQSQEWMEIDPKVWIAESVEIRKNIYPGSDIELSWDYRYKHIPTINQRLKMGGVRIAAYLNNLFDKSCDC